MGVEGGGVTGGRPHLVTVSGAKGGVGCTLIASALVAIWRRRGLAAVLVQLSRTLADELALFFPETEVADWTGRFTCSRETEEPWLLRPPASFPEDDGCLPESVVRRPASLVVFDASGATTERMSAAWLASDLVLGVGGLDLLGVRGLVGLERRIQEQGLAQDRCGLVLNRAGLAGGVREADCRAALGRRCWATLPDSGPEVAAWMARGLTASPGVASGGRLGEALAALTAQIDAALSDLPPLPGPLPEGEAPGAVVEVPDEAKQKMRRRLLERLGGLGRDQDQSVRRRRVTEAAAATVRELAGADGLTRLDVDRMVAQLVDELLGLGAIEHLVQDPTVTEVMINGPEKVYFEKDGRLHRADCRFGSSGEIVRLIDRVISPLGRRIDESSPMVDARLPDGSRLNAIIPPLALDGPSVTIRRFGLKALTVSDLVQQGGLSPELAERLRRAVVARKNILLSGGAGTGKTTLLNALSGFIPADERIITIEDAAELRLQQEHVVRLESRPPNVEGNGAVAIRDLVRNALRMRPDRIIVGEVRGAEALDMLQAMNTGHTGSLATIHANSAYDALSRLETMVLMANVALPLRVVREQVGAAIDLVLHLVRGPSGERRVGEALAVTGVAGGRYLVRRLAGGEEEIDDAVGQ